MTEWSVTSKVAHAPLVCEPTTGRLIYRFGLINTLAPLITGAKISTVFNLVWWVARAKRPYCLIHFPRNDPMSYANTRQPTCTYTHIKSDKEKLQPIFILKPKKKKIVFRPRSKESTLETWIAPLILLPKSGLFFYQIFRV